MSRQVQYFCALSWVFNIQIIMQLFCRDWHWAPMAFKCLCVWRCAALTWIPRVARLTFSTSSLAALRGTGSTSPPASGREKNPIKTCLKHQVMHYVKKCGTQVLALCGDLQYSCSCKCHLWCSLLIAEECFLCTNKSSTILLDQLEKNEFEQFAIPISMIGFL